MWLDRLRSFRTNILSGGLWLLLGWMLAGGELGDELGFVPTGKSDLARRTTQVWEVLGPAGRSGVLVAAASLVGGTVNFLLSLLLQMNERLSDHVRGLQTPTEEELARNDETDWSDRLARRNEGITRILVSLPLLLIGLTISFQQSWWLGLVMAVFAVLVGISGGSELYEHNRWVTEAARSTPKKSAD